MKTLGVPAASTAKTATNPGPPEPDEDPTQMKPQTLAAFYRRQRKSMDPLPTTITTDQAAQALVNR